MNVGDRVLVASGCDAYEADLLVLSDVADFPQLPGVEHAELRLMLQDGAFRRVAVVGRRDRMYGTEFVPVREVMFEDDRGTWWRVDDGAACTIEVLGAAPRRRCAR